MDHLLSYIFLYKRNSVDCSDLASEWVRQDLKMPVDESKTKKPSPRQLKEIIKNPTFSRVFIMTGNIEECFR